MPPVFCVAGIRIGLTVDPEIELPSPPGYLQPFLAHGPADLTLRVRIAPFPESFAQMQPSFNTPRWLFYQLQERLIFQLPLAGLPDRPLTLDIIPDQTCGTLYLPSTFFQHHYYPLSSPIFEFVFTTLLARQGGLLLHASGVMQDRSTFLFAGTSGSGKTTTARLWEYHAAARVLCDERIALRQLGSDVWAFGTPWHGDHPEVTPQGGRLDKIFFISHAAQNRAERIGLGRSSAMLYARSFPPLWDKTRLDAWIETSVRLAQQIPCFEFGFVPDASAVSYVQGLP